jgi:hypothetical protein
VADVVLIVSVEVPEALGKEGGAKPHVAPLGNPVQDRATLALKPPTVVSVTVDVAELPCVSVAGLSGFAAIRKSGFGGGAVLSSSTRPEALAESVMAMSGRPSLLKSATRTV